MGRAWNKQATGGRANQDCPIIRVGGAPAPDRRRRLKLWPRRLPRGAADPGSPSRLVNANCGQFAANFLEILASALTAFQDHSVDARGQRIEEYVRGGRMLHAAFSTTATRRRAVSGARARSHCRIDGGGGRLQPRQLGAHRAAERARFHRADAVEGRRHPVRRRIDGEDERLFQRVVQPPGGEECHRHAAIHFAAARQLLAQADGQRHGQYRLRHPDRAAADRYFQPSAQVLWGIKKLNLALALDNTGSMARQRQDDGAEDRGA